MVWPCVFIYHFSLRFTQRLIPSLTININDRRTFIHLFKTSPLYVINTKLNSTINDLGPWRRYIKTTKTPYGDNRLKSPKTLLIETKRFVNNQKLIQSHKGLTLLTPRNAIAILRHTSSLDSKVVKRFGSSSPWPDSVINIDINFCGIFGFCSRRLKLVILLTLRILD